MRKFLTFIPILLLSTLSCLNPGRDNPNDPENEDMAYLGGTDIGIDDNPIFGASIKLLQDDHIVEETQSDEEGWYEFVGVEPGNYDLIAEAHLYTTVDIHGVHLPEGGWNDTFDLYFKEIFFDFENVPVGSQNIPMWTVQAGDWRVIQDTSGPAFHTVPNVYEAEIATGAAYCLTDYKLYDFFCEVSMKAEDINPAGWQMGIYFRYLDPNNYYRLRISDLGPHTIVINKVVGGNNTTLFTDASPINKNTWYEIRVSCLQESITCTVSDGQGLDITEVIMDNDLDHGKIGMLMINPGLIHFDDVKIRIGE